MPIVCPDPAALAFWRDIMAASGGTLILASLLLIQIAVRSRVSSWSLWLASVLSVAFALGVAATSFLLFAHLNDLPAQLARAFSDYPYDCIPYGHGGTGHIANLRALAQQAVAATERAAIDLAVAVVALVALVACATLCLRAVGHRTMTLVTRD